MYFFFIQLSDALFELLRRLHDEIQTANRGDHFRKLVIDFLKPPLKDFARNASATLARVEKVHKTAETNLKVLPIAYNFFCAQSLTTIWKHLK